MSFITSGLMTQPTVSPERLNGREVTERWRCCNIPRLPAAEEPYYSTTAPGLFPFCLQPEAFMGSDSSVPCLLEVTTHWPPGLPNQPSSRLPNLTFSAIMPLA